MRYHTMIAGRERTVDVEPAGGSQYRVALDGEQGRIVDAQQVEPQVLSLLAGGRSYEAIFAQDGESEVVKIGDASFEIELLDERRHKLRQARGGAVVSGPVVVRAPMPGKIVKVLVQVGQDVAVNDGLVIIEAMKMENELRSPKAGKVRDIRVEEGQTVESRAELVSVE